MKTNLLLRAIAILLLTLSAWSQTASSSGQGQSGPPHKLSKEQMEETKKENEKLQHQQSESHHPGV